MPLPPDKANPGPGIYRAVGIRAAVVVIDPDHRAHTVPDEPDGWTKRSDYTGRYADLIPLTNRQAWMTVWARLGIGTPLLRVAQPPTP